MAYPPDGARGGPPPRYGPPPATVRRPGYAPPQPQQQQPPQQQQQQQRRRRRPPRRRLNKRPAPRPSRPTSRHHNPKKRRRSRTTSRKRRTPRCSSYPDKEYFFGSSKNCISGACSLWNWRRASATSRACPWGRRTSTRSPWFYCWGSTRLARRPFIRSVAREEISRHQNRARTHHRSDSWP